MRRVSRRGVDWCVCRSEWTESFWDDWEEGWEEQTLNHVNRFAGDGVFVDVGAWIGPVTMWAARLGPVLSVEPDPVALAWLETNCAMNAPDVQIAHGALTRETGVAFIKAHNRLGNSMTRLASEGVQTQGWVLPDLLEEFGVEKISMLKMDVEGAESELLEHVGSYLSQRNVPLLFDVHETWWSRPVDPSWLSGYDSIEGYLGAWGQVLCH